MNTHEVKGRETVMRRHSRLALNVVALLVVPVLGCAQDRDARGAGDHAGRAPGDQKMPGSVTKARRLETVTWNPVSHELTWVVANGDNKTGASSRPDQKQTYEINMDAATMTVNGEKRGFSHQEAENVQVLMDILTKYTIESTVWWEDGEGVRLDNKGNPLPDGKQPKKRIPGDLHAGGPGLFHASTVAAPPAGADEIAALRQRVAELEQRLRQVEQRRQAPLDALSPVQLRQAVALVGQ